MSPISRSFGWATRLPHRPPPDGLALSAPTRGVPPSPSMNPSPFASLARGTIDHDATARTPAAAQAGDTTDAPQEAHDQDDDDQELRRATSLQRLRQESLGRLAEGYRTGHGRAGVRRRARLSEVGGRAERARVVVGPGDDGRDPALVERAAGHGTVVGAPLPCRSHEPLVDDAQALDRSGVVGQPMPQQRVRLGGPDVPVGAGDSPVQGVGCGAADPSRARSAPAIVWRGFGPGPASP